MRVSHLSEVFWEFLENFIEVSGDLLSLQPGLMRKRAALYTSRFLNLEGPLDRYVGLLPCIKINICRPGGPNNNQKGCYSRHKRIHSLRYMTITTPDELIFTGHCFQDRKRYNMTLLRRSGWEEELDEILNTDGDHYYSYSDSAFTI